MPEPRFWKERAEMGFWQSANSILQTVSSNSVDTKPRSMESIILQTAESHLRDEAKIEALKALNNADDWAALQRDDREKVRQYEMAKLPWRKATGSGDEGEEMGHILGDVTIQQAPNKNPISGLIVPLATIGLIGYIAHEMLNKEVPAKEQTQIEQVDTDTDTRNTVDVGFGIPEYRANEKVNRDDRQQD